ncbi:MAG: rhodanese protein [Frankiales bacterium]|nr:rhodanese protein [Frankiales bacterium]
MGIVVRMTSSDGRSIDDLLSRARGKLQRLSPVDAAAALSRGALVVDTRPVGQRVEHGQIPGALVIERNVLEWRLDPTSSAAIPAASYDAEVVVVCQEGYASSLAAATLVDLGITRATDLEGGFAAWRAAGLPTVPATA